MTTKTAEKRQIDKFREAAREVATDERDETFDAVLRKITATKKLKLEKPDE